MARKSRIDRLPPEIRELIARLREQGRTIDEIRAKLAELDVEIARSTLGRHIAHLDAWHERMRWSREMAEALVERLGRDPDDRVARLNIEMMHALIMRMLAEAGDMDARDAFFLTSALQKLAAAAKADVDRAARVRREFAEKLEVLEREAGPRRLDPETLRQVREQLYG